MTDKVTLPRAVVEQALEALSSLFSGQVDETRAERCSAAITALRQALETAGTVEPVAWPTTPEQISDFVGSNYVWRDDNSVGPSENDKYCMTAHDLISAFVDWIEFGPQATNQDPKTDAKQEPVAWQGLTPVERIGITQIPDVMAMLDAIEAKLREKNGGVK